MAYLLLSLLAIALFFGAKAFQILRTNFLYRNTPGFVGFPFTVPGRLFTPSEWNFQSLLLWQAGFDYNIRFRSSAFLLRSFFSPKMTLVLTDIEAIKTVNSNPTLFAKPAHIYKALGGFGSNLVVSDGEQWRRHRKVAGSSFGHEASRVAWDESTKVCQQWIETTDSDSEGSAVIGAKSALAQLTFMVICRAGFGYPAPWPGSEEDVIAPHHNQSFYGTLSKVFPCLIFKSFFPEWSLSLPFKKLCEMKAVLVEFREYISEMVEERRLEIGEGVMRHDLFTALIRANDDGNNRVKLNDDELMSNIYVFMIAGHDTTASTLTAALMMLALYPKAQESILEEINPFFNKYDNAPPFTEFSNFHYTTATFYEASRLFPSVCSIPKVVTEGTSITVSSVPTTKGEVAVPQQIFLPGGTNVRVNVAGVHQDPSLYPEPYLFKPERFIESESKGKWNRDAHLSFSAGQRGCIGRQFSIVEATMILAQIVRNFEIQPVDKEAWKLKEGESERERLARIYQPRHGVTLSSQSSMDLKFVRRTAVSS